MNNKMQLTRIYQSGSFEPEKVYQLTPNAARHVGLVLRKKEGDALCVFNGKNEEFEAVITAVNKKNLEIKVISKKTVNRESPVSVILAQAISKGDKLDWVVQKSVELGVASIQPLITHHCSVKMTPAWVEKKMTHWQAIAVSACEQSGRNIIPSVLKPLGFMPFIEQSKQSLNIFLDPTGDKHLNDLPRKDKDIQILTGPEGGLNQGEIQVLIEKGWYGYTMGPRILRTETAAIVSLGVVQFLLGGL